MLLTTITPETNITLDIVQAVSAVLFLFSGAWAWFKVKQGKKDSDRDIQDIRSYFNLVTDDLDEDIKRVEREAKERLAGLKNDLVEKIENLEKTSKTFYTQSEARNDKLEKQMEMTISLIQEMNLQLKVHLSKCDINHKSN